MMGAWAKVLLVFLVLCELAVAGLYVMGVADPYVPGVVSNPHSLPRVAANNPLMMVTLPIILVVIVGAPVALVIWVWRFARRVGQRLAR